MPLDLALHLLDEGRIDPTRVLGDEHPGDIVEGLRGLDVEHRVRGVGGRQEDVGVGGLELADLGVEARGLVAVGHVHDDLVPVLLRQLLLHLVLVHDADRLELDAPLLLEFLHELEHREGEVPVVRRGPEEPFEAALGQRGRGRLGVQERDAVALGDLAGRRRHARVDRADDGVHLLLRDQALGLGLPHLRLALVVDDDEADLRAAEPRQPFGCLLHRRQVEVRLAVVQLGRHLDGRHRVDAQLRQLAGHRVDDADDDFLGRLGVRGGGEQGHQRQGQQCDHTTHTGSSSTD